MTIARRTSAARSAAERAARDVYGRLLAYLVSRTGNLADAEDALADAFASALEQWPRDGVPASPAAWLTTVARRRLSDMNRRAEVRNAAASGVLPEVVAEMQAHLGGPGDTIREIPDERLSMLTLCAHPAVAPRVRAPLMLQLVLGLAADRIGPAFLVAPASMGQRLVRAKRRIRDAGIRFEAPSAATLEERLPFILDAIYAAYGTGWEDATGDVSRRRGLALEALDLGRLLARLHPGDAEVHGLLALMCFGESRRDARRGEGGEFVPLSEQLVEHWDRALVEEAEKSLHRAAALGGAVNPGRYQLEAAIQAVHAGRLHGREVDAEALVQLYDALVARTGAVGAMVAATAARAEVEGPLSGLAALDGIPSDKIVDYQPWWALRADLLRRLGRAEEAIEAYRRALGLTEDAAVRRWLIERVAQLES